MMKFFLFFLLISTAQAGPKRVLFMVNDGFYADEYYVPLKIFQEKGLLVTTATKYKGQTLPDRRQVQTAAPVYGDITFPEADPSLFDAIVFAGGNGSWEDYFPNEDVHKLLTSFYKSGKLTALL